MVSADTRRKDEIKSNTALNTPPMGHAQIYCFAKNKNLCTKKNQKQTKEIMKYCLCIVIVHVINIQKKIPKIIYHDECKIENKLEILEKNTYKLGKQANKQTLTK